MRFGIVFAILLPLLTFGPQLRAQSFGDEETSQPSNAAAFGLLTEDHPEPETAKPAEKLQTTEDVARALAEEKAGLQKEKEDIFMPGGGTEKLRQPTQDKSIRGKATIIEMDNTGKTRGNSNIFMYMDNFAISRSIGGMVTCNMRFIILTNLDRRLVSLDTKLVWPGISTTLSFANVMPNTPTAYNYTLMGDGCYTMDKEPNIIVNRCRVRGMGSAECADKIIWLTNIKR